MATEPIEKKPLYHFYPGMKTLSVGFYGCNMSCNYCQNWKVSQQDRHDNSHIILPLHLVEIANTKECQAICFTYNEPTVYFEYISSVAFHAKSIGLKVVLKTNAMLNPKPWHDIISRVDAINVDWKGDSEASKKMTGVNYDIIPNLVSAIRSGCHVEVSIPVYADSIVDDYLAVAYALMPFPTVPVHLLKVFPAHLIQLSSTTDDKLISDVRELFLKNSYYVFSEHNRNTICSKCRAINLRRNGYRVTDESYSLYCRECSDIFHRIHKG